ncbi:microphthalmia-associated transcription factor-like [Hydractinia symbiolongicarpus]|uniref:microphthalmia-associated transcription factor-like n=1 Tax=Hydractinia symbiolongicarpus TaxID=13093 RepID=UPI00254B0F53|nr:microphthalmia-associated transcription factor-like [Hydractinia symbiolongicarpus]
MLSESGIDLDFDVFAEIEQDHKCYEVKAKSLTPSSTNPLVLMDPDMIKVKPDPDDPSVSASEQSIGVGSLTRTNFKLQLQREQLLEAEKKEQQRLKVLAAQCEKPDFRSSKLSNQKVLLSNLSTSFTLPSTSAVPMRSIRANLPTNLPSSVLKVETNLKNPTQYYIKEQQKRQVQQYLSSQRQQQSSVSMMPVSAPSALHNFNFNADVSSSSFLNPATNFISPNSPDTASSVASGSEVDSVLDDLFGLDTATDHDFNMFSDSVFSATLPTSNNLFDTYGINTSTQQDSHDQLASSCPANVKQEVPDTFMKERQKKDNHNMIERRRRYNINDRIKELGTLVPKLDNDFKQNKGTILKSSVDYIRRLKKDKDRLKHYENRTHNLEDMNKKLLLRVQELELILRASNISTSLPEPDLSSATSPQLTQLLVNSQLQQQKQQLQLGQNRKQQQMRQKQLASHSTVHNLLKAPPATSSEIVISSSTDSPRNVEMRSEYDDQDCMIMES